MRITCAGGTDVGRIRSTNEDTYLVAPDRGLFIVADGVGGQVAGEVASAMAVRGIARELGSPPALTDDQVGDRMRKAIQAVNNVIFQRALTEPNKRGMGTTITVLALSETRFLVGQVGDSRAYLLRGATLVPLTKDHSYVQELVDAGHLTPEQARTHPLRNVITRSIGGEADLVPDLYLGTVKPRDLYLLASDGLTGMLGDHDLAERLSRDCTPQDLVDDLIGEANRRGGVDNITAIVVRIEAVHAPSGVSGPPRRLPRGRP